MVKIEEISKFTATSEASRSCSSAEIGWNELLKQCRDAREKLNDHDSADIFSQTIHNHFPRLRNQLQKYNSAILNPEKLSKEEKKELILDTRNALRVVLSCSSLDASELRWRLVEEMVIREHFYNPLCQLLSSNRGDAKCRTLASQLISNLVTTHYEAANHVASTLALAPSEESVNQRIRKGISEDFAPDGVVEEEECQEEPSWVDMLLSCARAENRVAVSGIVAALHNLVISLQSSADIDKGQLKFAKDLASNDILVSTLLRQIISLQSLKTTFDKKDDKATATEATNEAPSLGDSATEWIMLLLIKCCKLGLLPNLMSSAAGGTNTNAASDLKIVPEHIVLLQCVQSEVETSILERKPDERNLSILGGEIGTEGVVSSHAFLAKLYCSLRWLVGVDSIAAPGTDDPDTVLQCSALKTVLEILASSLGVDSNDLSQTRRELGSNDFNIIQNASKELGTLVDTLSARNSGRSSRKFFMSNEEQRVITALVRFIGNVCHGCSQNQDLVRLTKVPLPIQMISSENDKLSEERNALHVLLSCTSIAHSCFTLREWAVVAIRNLLEHNELNQAEVAKLEANKPVQTSALSELGIRVEMDNKGKVSVIPEDKEV